MKMILAQTVQHGSGITLTHFEAVMTAIGALVTAVATLAIGLRWIYRQGVSSNKLVTAIDQNTAATTKLSGAYDLFTQKTDGTLTNHEMRITRTEDRIDRAETDITRLQKD